MTNEPKGAGYTRYNTPSTPHTHPRLQSEPCPNQNERDELDKYDDNSIISNNSWEHLRIAKHDNNTRDTNKAQYDYLVKLTPIEAPLSTPCDVDYVNCNVPQGFDD